MHCPHRVCTGKHTSFSTLHFMCARSIFSASRTFQFLARSHRTNTSLDEHSGRLTSLTLACKLLTNSSCSVVRFGNIWVNFAVRNLATSGHGCFFTSRWQTELPLSTTIKDICRQLTTPPTGRNTIEPIRRSSCS